MARAITTHPDFPERAVLRLAYQWRLASGAIQKLSYSSARISNPAHNGSSSNHRRWRHWRFGYSAHAASDWCARNCLRSGPGYAAAGSRCINLQPNAVRELYDLGFTEQDLDRVGLPAQEWALVGLNGNDIYSEPRGLLAGYNWPQYAVHRGHFHMLLHKKLVERAGPNVVRLGSRVTAIRSHSDGSVSALVESADGSAAESERCIAYWRRRHSLCGQGADASHAAADSLGRRSNVARHNPGEADQDRRVIRRSWHASSPDGLLSHLAS